VNSVWRELKVIDDHAVIVSDQAGWHGMQVVDLTSIAGSSSLPGNHAA
jgi:hypothetical protein